MASRPAIRVASPTAGHEHAVGEATRIAGLLAIETESRSRLARDIGQVRHAGLHAESQLVLLDACVNLRIADGLVVDFVEAAQAVEGTAANLRRHAVRIVDEQNRVPAGPEGDAGMLARHVARRPKARRD